MQQKFKPKKTVAIVGLSINDGKGQGVGNCKRLIVYKQPMKTMWKV